MGYSVVASAPGNAYAIGDFIADYGEPAILFAVDKRLYVRAEKNRNVVFADKNLKPIQNFFPKDVKTFAKGVNDFWEECNEKQGEDKFSILRSFIKREKAGLLRFAIGLTLEKLETESGVYYETSSDIPRGMSLGSSAALAIATPMAIAKLYKTDLSKQELNEIAHKIEKINHGYSSGADNTVSCYGGSLRIEKGNREQLDVPKLKDFIIVDAGKPEKTTKERISYVRDMDPAYRDPFIKSLGRNARAMEEAMRKEDYNSIEELMNYAHRRLSLLGVSNDEMDRINEDIKRMGGGSKLIETGNGAMLCHHSEKKKLNDYFENGGYRHFEVELGTEGARIEQ